MADGRAPGGTVAIVCGGGRFPAALVGSLQRQGRPFFLFLLRGFADPSLARHPHQWIGLGSLGAFLKRAKSEHCREVVIIGNVVRPRISQLRLDLGGLLALPGFIRHYFGGDNRVLTGLANLLTVEGFTLRGAHEIAPELVMPEGSAGSLQPNISDRKDIEFAFAMLRALSPFDVGQAAVVADQRVIAIEAVEGTRAMLARIAELRRSGRLDARARTGILVKSPKLGQERRLDMPAIGIETLEEAETAGLRGIAVEAGGTLVDDLAAFPERADRAGLFVVAVAPAGGVS
jgi:DUF1009 family protein